MIIFKIYTLGKLRSKANKIKIFFREYIQDDSSKKSTLKKSWEQHQGKVSIFFLVFWLQRKLENFIQKHVSSRRNSK